MPVDHLLASLGNLNRGSNTYGFLFGSAHHLFELIPRIRQDAGRADAQAMTTQQVATFITNYAIETRAWRSISSAALLDAGSDEELTGSIYEEAILVYLYLSFYASRSPKSELFEMINPCLDRFVQYLSRFPQGSSLDTTLMWPLLIAGSCMRLPGHRSITRNHLESSHVSMTARIRTLQLLDFVWADSANGFGLQALARAMEAHNFNICIG